MKTELYSVDCVEKGTARLLEDGGRSFTVPAAKLSEGVCAGCRVFLAGDGLYHASEQDAGRIRQSISRLNSALRRK